MLDSSSDRAIKKTAQAITYVFGQGSVEPYLSKSLTERIRFLSEHFEIKKFHMKRRPKDNEKDSMTVDEDGYIRYEVMGVAAKDFDDLVKDILLHRKINPAEAEVCCGLDDGKSFNKIGFILKDKSSEETEETELFQKEFKYSGVKRLFLASVVPETPENHHNQKQMLESIGMEGLEWGSTTDIKMALLLVGKSNGQLTFGCPFCNICAPYMDDS